ncbi:metallophosphoesterase family protein [Streptomyces sp. TS71-3]|uniref:purple acid phosphatase family protein n=1 Tax=Streptomyces sp. TS71-3 TaxID=2733862 RepID=UPI00201837B8|nr:metallophosphoesterase family protein [Streptomyces sp. TS71-3]
MSNDEQLFTSYLSRRGMLAAAGVVGTAVAAGPLAGSASAAPSSSAATAGTPSAAGGPAGDPRSTPVVNGLHLQFGADASSEVVVSWHTLQPVKKARVLLGGPDGRYARSYQAQTASYTDAQSGQVVYAQHARLTGLAAGREYVYLAVHEGTQPVSGTFATAPKGRAAFTFTSFGDQGTPTTGKKFVPPAGVELPNPPFVNDNLGGPASGNLPTAIERVQPLFHLFNGDLCYANLATDRVRTWSDFWDNNTRSARFRPWMPAPGNHENELGNGPIGYRAFQTYFSLPRQAGQTDDTAGLWYAMTVGSVRVIFLANDDICLQDGGSSYVRGYSNGAQKAWLEKELRRTRADRDIDWVVVCMHQVAVSTADQFNGADLAIRQEWLPLFDEYGVDLVVCGHEHHYERSHPIRGRQENATLTPVPAATRTDVIDTTEGTVHMVIGGGGTSAPSNQLFFNPPACRVITSVGPADPTTGKRPPVYTREDAPWSAVRDSANSYGFAAFSVDPGRHPGDRTRITVTYYDVVGTQGELKPFETFTLERRRSDG